MPTTGASAVTAPLAVPGAAGEGGLPPPPDEGEGGLEETGVAGGIEEDDLADLGAEPETSEDERIGKRRRGR
jgi:hypothetical protein